MADKVMLKLKKDEPDALTPIERAHLLRLLVDELSAKYMLTVYEERSAAAEDAARKVRKAEAEVKKIAKDNEQTQAEWAREEEEEEKKNGGKKRKKRDGDREAEIIKMQKAEKAAEVAVEEVRRDSEATARTKPKTVIPTAHYIATSLLDSSFARRRRRKTTRTSSQPRSCATLCWVSTATARSTSTLRAFKGSFS